MNGWSAEISNNLMRGNTCWFVNNGLGTWLVIDNVFDTMDSLYGDSSVAHHHNGYVNMSDRLDPQVSSDTVVSSYAWQPGPLGAYYQLAVNNPFYGKSSRSAASAGLYH